MQSPALSKCVNLFRGICKSNNRSHSEICLVVEKHSFLIYFSKRSARATNYQVTEKAVYSVYTALEDLLNGANSFVSTCLNNNFDDVATSCSAVNVSVSVINGYTVYSALNLAKLNIKLLKTTSFSV